MAGFISGMFNNMKDRFQNHTLVGRLLQGESLGGAIKDKISEDTPIGRMITKDESIFTAQWNATKNTSTLGDIFGCADKEEAEE